MPLTDEQIAQLTGGCLREAYRLGLLRAAEVCDVVYRDIAHNWQRGDFERALGVRAAIDAIRAEAGEG